VQQVRGDQLDAADGVIASQDARDDVARQPAGRYPALAVGIEDAEIAHPASLTGGRLDEVVVENVAWTGEHRRVLEGNHLFGLRQITPQLGGAVAAVVQLRSERLGDGLPEILAGDRRLLVE